MLHALLKEKIKSADDVASWVNSGDMLEFGMSIQQPDVFDVALAAQKDRLTDVTIRGTLSTRARQVMNVTLNSNILPSRTGTFRVMTARNLIKA